MNSFDNLKFKSEELAPILVDCLIGIISEVEILELVNRVLRQKANPLFMELKKLKAECNEKAKDYIRLYEDYTKLRLEIEQAPEVVGHMLGEKFYPTCVHSVIYEHNTTHKSRLVRVEILARDMPNSKSIASSEEKK